MERHVGSCLALYYRNRDSNIYWGSLMDHISILQAESIELTRLLKLADGDPVIVPQLENRLREVKQRFDTPTDGILFPPEPSRALPRAAFFLSHESDSVGIKPSVAGSVLVQYERMFIEQAMHEERMQAAEEGRQRRHRGLGEPVLALVGTPKGSFGFEFSPTSAQMALTHEKALRQIAEAVRLISQPNSELPNVLQSLPSKVIRPLKQFIKTVSDANMSLRFAFADLPSFRIPSVDLADASRRLEREVQVEDKSFTGTLRGLPLDSGQFDFKTSLGQYISGMLSDALTEEDYDRLLPLINRDTIVDLQETTIIQVDGTKTAYVLIDAHKSNQPSGKT